MNIWIVNHYALTPDMSGGTRHYDIAKQLIAKGHSVTIFASSYHYAALRETKQYDKGVYREEKIDGIDFVWIKTRPYRTNGFERVLNMLDFTRKVMRTAMTPHRDRPDIIVGSSVHLFAVYAAYKAARFHNVPFVMEIRDIWPQTLIDMGVSRHHPFILLLAVLERFLYRRAAKIITLLPRADQHIRRFGVNEEDIFWVSNGVDLQRFENPPNISMLDPERFNILYTGTFGTANNLDILVKVARKLAGTGSLHFTLVGDGPDRKMLEAASRELPNMTVREPVPKTHVASLLKQADILYVGLKSIPLYRFGMSMNKLFDYMSAGRPILFAGDVAENPVTAAQCGIVVPGEDVDKIANALTTLYNATQQTRDDYGQNGLSYVKEHFSMEVIAGKFEHILQKAINEHEHGHQ